MDFRFMRGSGSGPNVFILNGKPLCIHNIYTKILADVDTSNVFF